MNNFDEAVNGKGLRIILEAEGVKLKDDPTPWIIPGEKDNLSDEEVKGVSIVEDTTKLLFSHSCTNPDCGVKRRINTVMTIRRAMMVLKDNDRDMYLTLMTVLAMYCKTGLNASQVLNAVLLGMSAFLTLDKKW